MGGLFLLRHVLEGVVTDPKAVVSERVGDLTFQFRAGELFQNNPFILPHMVDHVVGEAKSEGARFLVDAYCGSDCLRFQPLPFRTSCRSGSE